MERAQRNMKEIHLQSAAEEDTKQCDSSTHYVFSRKQSVCHRWLGVGHSPGSCHFKSVKCNKCHKTGRIAKACQTAEASKQTRQKSQNSQQSTNPMKKATTHQINYDSSNQLEVVDIVHVHIVSPDIPRSYKVLTKINEISITMELDAGAGVNLISEKTWANKLNRPDLQHSPSGLQSYPNKPLDVMGSCTVKVKIHGKTNMLPLVVVRGDGISLLGRNWLEKMKLESRNLWMGYSYSANEKTKWYGASLWRLQGNNHPLP